MPKRYQHLTYAQRCQIYALKKRGFSQEEIAKDMGVSQGTISRELRRNKGKRGYRFKQASEHAARRCSAAHAVATVMTPSLIARAESMLVGSQWSPEQIAAALFREHGTKVSPESLYSHIWSNKRAGGTLYKHLRQQGKKRNKRSGKNAGRGMIPGRVDIKERPKVVDSKTRLGDWELDSIIGAKHVGAITSIVERKSKLTKLVLLKGPTADATRKGIVKRLKPVRAHVLTLTSDNGREFAGHQKIARNLEASFFFATPYHSWERGLNENTNGLVRQYFPKGMDFATITNADVRRVEDLLNNRPRKTLGYRSPNEVFAQLAAPPDYALKI
jgi:IS30 family transposase